MTLALLIIKSVAMCADLKGLNIVRFFFAINVAELTFQIGGATECNRIVVMEPFMVM